MARHSIVHVRPRAHQLALHLLARDGGHAEREGARERTQACEEALKLLAGEELPACLCDTWWRAAGHGEAQ